MRIVSRSIVAALVLSIGMCFSPRLRAADPAPTDLPVLKIVPEDALAVVIVSRLDRANEQIGKLTAEMQIPAPNLLQMLQMMAGIQQGTVDNKGSAVLAIVPAAAGDSTVGVHFVPVTDYKQFIAQFKPANAAAEIVEINLGGHPAIVGHKGDFAVIAGKSEEDTLKKVLASSKSITPVIGSLAGWAGEHEISFVAMPTGVKRGVAVALKGLEQVKAVMAGSNDPSAKMAAGSFEMYDWFLKAADKEVSQFAAGVRVDNDGGLHLDTRTLFVSGGSWAASGNTLARPEGNMLACLPGGPYMFAFGGAMPKGFSKNMLNLWVDMISNMSKVNGGKELTEDQTKKLNQLMEKSMGSLRSMSMVMGTPKPGESIYSNMAAVMKVNNAKQFMKEYQETMESMTKLLKETGAQIPFIQEVKQAKIGGDDGIELTMDMTAMFKGMGNNPAAAKMLDVMIGKGGKMTAYIVPIDNTTVAISYINSNSIARVKAACKNPQTSLAADADIAQTEKLLPEGAQWAGYIDPKGFVDFVSVMMLTVAPPGGAMPMLPAFPQTPPVGFGAKMSGQGLDLQIVVPGAALKGVGTYVQQLQQMGGPGRAAPPQIR